MLLVPWWVGLLALVGGASAQGLSADDVARSALAHDPTCLAALAEVHAAEGRLRAASGLRANPQLSAGRSTLDPRSSLSLQQPLSLSGEGLARQQAAAAALEAARLEQQRAALVTAAAARAAWLDVVAAEARRALAEQALDAARARRVAVEGRAAQGEAAALDARLARLAEAEVALALAEARAEAAAARVALARFVPDAASVALEGEPRDAAPPPRGGDRRADVQAAALRVDAATAGLRAERAAVLPPVALGAFMELEADMAFAGPSVQVTLPVWTANPEGRAEALAELERARASAEATRRAAVAEQQVAEANALASRAAAGGLSGDPVDDALAALAALDRAEALGELDGPTATLLRQQALAGAMAAISLEQAAARAELAALLASSDPALLPVEVSP